MQRNEKEKERTCSSKWYDTIAKKVVIRVIVTNWKVFRVHTCRIQLRNEILATLPKRHKVSLELKDFVYCCLAPLIG